MLSFLFLEVAGVRGGAGRGQDFLLFQNRLDDGNRVGSRLSGAGLSPGEDVLPLQSVGNHGGLDESGLFKSSLLYGVKEAGVQLEIFEGRPALIFGLFRFFFRFRGFGDIFVLVILFFFLLLPLFLFFFLFFFSCFFCCCYFFLSLFFTLLSFFFFFLMKFN